MGEDFLTHEGRIQNRVISSYANYRASRWNRAKALDAIVEEMKLLGELSLGYEHEERRFIQDIADAAKIQQVIENSERHPCPEQMVEKIMRATYLYSDRYSRQCFAYEHFGSIDFPLFSEEVYEYIERGIKK